MKASQLSRIGNFGWGIDVDVLRDLNVRVRYRDVIFPMTVIRRLDAVLEPNKKVAMGLIHQAFEKWMGNREERL